MLKKIFLLAILPLALTGCSSLGPAKIHTDRGAYNEIVRQTDYEQLLTNIVHLSYAEPTAYLKVTNVTASYSLSKTASFTPSWSDAITSGVSTLTTGVSGEPSISYSDSPTISYMPVNDASFMTVLQSPISFANVDLMFHGDYDNVNLLFTLLFSRIGVLDNAASASSLEVMTAPRYQACYHFIQTLAAMSENGTATLKQVVFNTQPGLMISFDPSSVNSAEANELKQLLQIPLDSKSIVLMDHTVGTLSVDATTGQLDFAANQTTQPKNLVYVHTRSIYDIMVLLSHAVQIPEADRKAHLTAELNDANGQPYDWAPLMKGILTIYSSDQDPKDAFVKTWTNNHWFYIKNTDINSKVSFAFLVRLMALTAGLGASGVQTAPVLTVAVK